ncbi:hypothetical protein IU485_28005 [Nocardia cyriacigeorgica]|uniref:hypothetical protein n=1 Tax=Nocardia cyriacigeorgica TaxID=135487 RepID=UPI0018948AB8|nr:hypothetical protein [Nocardia cyriacigeorgica]MBF6085217.1 hypothetical protein [Nocardia cyriacigeorgica]
MGVYATPDDVRARFEADIPDSQTGWLDARITDAESLLITLRPALAGGPSTVSATVADNARRVVADAVLRLLRNPGGAREQSVGPYRVVYDSDDGGQSGIYYTADDLAAFSIGRRRYGMVGIAKPRWVP